MAFNWDDYPAVDDNTSEDNADSTPSTAVAENAVTPAPEAFNWEDHPVVADSSAAPATSPVTAATTGFLNLSGIGSRLGALGRTGMDAAVGNTGPLSPTKSGMGIQDLIDEYNELHAQLQKEFATAAAAHPVVAAAGGLAGTGAALAPLGAAAMTAKGLAGAGAVMGAGNTADLTDLPDVAKNAAMGAGTSLALGKTIEAAHPLISKALAPLGQKISSGLETAANYLGDTAEDLAVKATGATGKQTEKFAPNTGRELLNRGIVKFGSSPANIAENAQNAIDQSAEGLSGALKQLDDEGVTVDRNTVIKYIKDKIAGLSNDESQTGLSNKLQDEIGNIQSKITSTTPPVTPPTGVSPDYTGIPSTVLKASRPLPGRLAQMSEAGDQAAQANLQTANQMPFDPYNNLPSVENSEIPISQAEKIKRGYQDKVGDWTAGEASKNANAITSSAYREAVENAAGEANQEIGDQFLEDKKTYGLLSPVQEAAQKRANTLQQSPHGGLLDIAAAGAGGGIGTMIGGPVGTVVGGAAGLAAKGLRPRYAAAGAVSADMLGDIVKKAPQVFGPRFSKILSDAAGRSAISLNATDYILNQTSQEYRDQKKAVFGGDSDQDQE